MTIEQRESPRFERHGGDGEKTPHISIAGRRLPIPRSRLARTLSGGTLVVLGMFGFLPVLGFWMIPLGLLILSYDMPSVRRLRRRMEVWWSRRRRKRASGRPGAEPDEEKP